MATPANKRLYKQVKEEIYRKHPVHSAYRSGLLVKTYKQRGGKYIGSTSQTSGLRRWFREKWTNQRGQTGYTKKSDVYRPTVRVSKDTPTTFKELSPKQIKRARREKAKSGRVKRFNKRS